MKIDTVYIEITNRCNLNCATCYNQSGLNRTTVEITFQAVSRLIEHLLPYGLKRILLSGGEPSLHSDFNGMLNLVDRYPSIVFGIVTNGTNFHRRLIEMLNTRENMTLQISLDGSCEEINSRTRGAGNFAKTIIFANNIHMLKGKPLLKMVVSQYNIQDVEAYYELALSLDFLPEYGFIYKSGNGVQEWDNKAVTPRQIMQVVRTIGHLNTLHSTNAFIPQCTWTCPLTGGLEKLSLSVKSDGSIQPCQSLYEMKYCVGNLYSLDMSELEKNLQRFSNLAQKRKQQDYGCHRCILKDACGRGCLAEAVHLHTDPLADDGFCVWRKMEFIEHELSVKEIQRSI